MALSASTVLEVRIGGSDTNGGGFVTGSSGTDWSQQTSAQYAVADGVTNGTTTITSATAAFGTDVVGNLIYVSGGTGSVVAGWYQIVTRTNATTIAVDRSTGLTAGTGVTLNIGGALLSPAIAASIATVVGMITYIKYNVTAFSITTASYNVAGGCCQPTSGTYIVGYDTTRALYTPYQNRPTIQLTVGTASIYQALNNTYYLQSVILDANSQTASVCANTAGEFFYVKVMNFMSMGIKQNNVTACAILCEATGGNGSAFCIQVDLALYCVSHNNTQTFNQAAISSTYCYGCISYGNSQSGFSVINSGCVVNCTSYGNGDKGYYWGNTSGTTETAINCIAEGNTTYGYYVNNGLGQLINCADYNNTSGRKNSASLWAADIGPITGSGSFFTNAASQNFTLNSTVGAGALLRNIGFPTNLLGMGNNYLDIGALQAQCLGVAGMIASFETANAATWRKVDVVGY